MGLKFLKLKSPIEISLKAFILRGKFDCLKIGATKSWLQHNFVEPDDVMAGHSYESSPIWRYGNIELHFVGDVLSMIYSDYVGELDGGAAIEIDKWILASRTSSKMIEWIQEFNRCAADYRMQHDPDINQFRILLNENADRVSLTFGDEDKTAIDANDFELTAIQIGPNDPTPASLR